MKVEFNGTIDNVGHVEIDLNGNRYLFTGEILYTSCEDYKDGYGFNHNRIKRTITLEEVI